MLSRSYSAGASWEDLIGLANALMGVINARTDQVPMLVLSGRTPVVEGGRLLGILSGHDVLEALVAAEARQLKELATERLLIDTGSY